MKSSGQVVEKLIEKCRRDKDFCRWYCDKLFERLKIIETALWSWCGINIVSIVLVFLKLVGKLEFTVLACTLITSLIVLALHRRRLIRLIDTLSLESDPMDDSKYIFTIIGIYIAATIIITLLL